MTMISEIHALEDPITFSMKARAGHYYEVILCVSTRIG